MKNGVVLSKGIWITGWFLLLLLFSRNGWGYPDSLYSATDQEAICEVTGEELLGFSGDFFPLSLAERARQSAASWRGMLPGFLDYEFDGIPLRNSLWGYWDNQFLPFEYARKRRVEPAFHRYRIHPLQLPFHKKPVTRIAYSQDFGFGMSYFDAEFRLHYTPTNFIRLGGGNYLRRGPYPDYTATQVNTYRAQFHHRFSERWTMDLWYLELRHRYDIVPWPYFTALQKVHRVGRLFWAHIHLVLAPHHRITITPILQPWFDQYWKERYTEQFKTTLLSGGLQGRYSGEFGRHHVGLFARVWQDRIRSSLHLREVTRHQAETHLHWQYDVGGWKFAGEAGLFSVQDVGSAFLAAFRGSYRWRSLLEVAVEAGEKPQALPLVAQYARGDSLRPLSSPRLPRRRSLQASLIFRWKSLLKFSLTPFYHQYLNAPFFRQEGSRFYQKDQENLGISSRAIVQLPILTLDNRSTYTYYNQFSPLWNNVVMVKVPLELFNRALKLEGYAIYHAVYGWRPLGYTPLWNQFFTTGSSEETYHWLDFKILAHVKSATLFFVWANTLSWDYALVDNYWEFYRTFRLGVYWTLFN